jgi:hypothetical protein
VSCPDRAELDALFEADAARASALLAHVRECPRCTEALADATRGERGPEPRGDRRRQRGPRPAIVGLVAVGVALMFLSRLPAFLARRREVAPVTSASPSRLPR